MGDNLARDHRGRQQSSIMAEINKARGQEPEAAKETGLEAAAGVDIDPLPEPGDPYKAYSRPGNKPEITLHVLLQDGFWRGFAWSNYDSVETVSPECPGVGPMLVVRFTGLAPTELRMCGSNLGRLHAYIGQNRIAWIREHPSKRGFGGAAARDDKAEVITGIIITPWKRPGKQADDDN